MLQRIQTVYLLIITILGGLACWFQMDFFLAFTKEITGVSSMIMPVFALALILIPVFALIAIFLFKKRNLQIKFIWIAIIFIVIYYLITFYIRIKLQLDVKLALSHFSIIFNLINLILCNLAITAIKKDEKLVRSLDRIR
ncbi:MAG: DUF4293 domain-containing protein [Prevotellaceae bacterium]|jgi:hypothetical protein|nr:DUF4293 domain-containing protein [Prevotellaceae bacterium]